ncbi:MAG: hypothetical protein KGQ89_10800, partial [Verrucomicrobia bacterium]|nr:hypothetical protein [Verrucomicrobiota bacterium]
MNAETGRTLRWLLALGFLAGMIIFGVWKIERAIQKTTSSAAHRLDQVLAAITGSSTKMVADRAVIE